MFTPEFITETALFFGVLFAALVMLSRFFAALERWEPGLIPDDVPSRTPVKGIPPRFTPGTTAAARVQLRALVKTWPYGEVERLRRWALLFLALALVIFVVIAVRYA